jgi:UDP-glucose 4-epimerase
MILVLGYGFVAKQLVKAISLLGIDYIVYSRNGFSENHNFICDDISNISKYSYKFSGIHTIIFTAHDTVPFTADLSPNSDTELHLAYAKNVVEIAVSHHIPKIIYLSTCGAIYGNPIYMPVDEQHPTLPISTYGKTKLAVENFLLQAEKKYNIQIILVRTSNLYGAGQDIKIPQGVINHFIYNTVHRYPITIWGDGSAIKDYLFIDDFIEALCLLINQKIHKHTIYNIAYGTSLSLEEILDSIKYFATLPEIIYLPAKDFDVHKIVVNNNRFVEEYGWKPKTLIQDGLSKMYTYINNNNQNRRP